MRRQPIACRARSCARLRALSCAIRRPFAWPFAWRLARQLGWSCAVGLTFASAAARADETPKHEPTAHAPEAPQPLRGHGPEAPDSQFPSHVFQLRAHEPPRVQLAFQYGLNQPIFTHGFNAAVDVRYKRLILTYSHGQGLDATSFLNTTETRAGMTLAEPWTTGGGVGLLLIDELWVLADLKVHRFEASTSLDHVAYTNVTIGGEIGWRFFVWKGFNIALVARYWPNVYSTAGNGVTLHDANGKPFFHKPLEQGYAGFLGNVLVGWAFDL
jgi:hypothetical protein